MESTGEASKIHISDATKRILETSSGDYTFKCRGKVDIKGIGEQTTWWLSRESSNVGKASAKSREKSRMRTSASKDGLYAKNFSSKMRSDSSFHRRSSGVALEKSREKSMDFDFGIMQNAMRSNRNLIEPEYNFSIIKPERAVNSIQQTRVNHSENQLLLHHLPQTFSAIEFPNGTKRSLQQQPPPPPNSNRVNTNAGKLLNGNRGAPKEYYDYNDRLNNAEVIEGNQFNDPDNSEQYDSYEDNSLNAYYDSKRQLGNKKFQIGGKPANDYDYYSSSENGDKKSRSCTDLKIF